MKTRKRLGFHNYTVTPKRGERKGWEVVEIRPRRPVVSKYRHTEKTPVVVV